MIQLTGAGKRYGPKILFENTDWLVTPNERTGIVGANGTGKTSVLEALVYLGTGRSFRGAPREALVRGGAERALIRAELRHDASPTLVEAEVLPAGRSRTQVNRKTASGRKDLAAARPESRAADEGERDVAAELAGEALETAA